MNITKWIKHYQDADYFPVGEGWRKFIMKLAEDIADVNPDTEVNQVKEKFGTLRFYCSGGDEVGKLIEKAEWESGKTCERCGSKKNVTTKGGWLKTLCSKCHKAKD
ncbi:MAG: hypothetical protein KKC77_19790 [Proteobacteria bacterium]|nr:hypothetical protein [Pseudomonadota bacterium]